MNVLTRSSVQPPVRVTPPVSNATIWGVAVLVAGLLVGLVMVVVLFDSQSLVQDRFDPYHFGEMGKILARGDGFDSFLIQRKAPLYPLLIGAVYFLFGEQPRIIQFLQVAFFAGTCWLAFDMGRRVFNVRTGAIAGLICAFHPLMLRYVADLHLETLLTFLFTLMVWGTVRFYFKPTIANGVLLGVVAAAAALTKAVAVFYPIAFIAVFAAIIVFKRRPDLKLQRPFFLAVAAVGIAMIAVIAPWTARNYQASNGQFILISTGLGDAFLRGYVFSQTDYALLQRPPYTDAENESNAWFTSLAADAGATWEQNEYETDRILTEEAKRKLVAEPGQFVRKSVVGLFTFWYEMTSLPNSLMVGLAALGAWGLALIGVARSWREGRPVWLFLMPALYLNLLLAVLLALGRYSAPVIPALLVASAFGVDTILNRLGRLRA